MKKWILLFLLLSCEAFALDAVVTVLESPLFKYPSREAPVVQYKRKGDIIRIHGSIANDSKFDEMAPAPEKLAALRAKMKEDPDYNQDPMFKGEEDNTFFIEDEFIPTLDRQGHRVYILSEHIYVYFNDSREFKQNIARKDETDYRLEEPLSKNYPLTHTTGYRGVFLLGFTQPYYESYPYNTTVKKKGYSSPVEGNFTYLRTAPGNYKERLFLGGSLNFRTFENTYSLEGLRFSRERGYKFGLGPTIAYDAYKGQKDRINLSASVIVNLLDQLDITQQSATFSETRTYRTYSLAPRISVQYHRKEIFPELDFVLGTMMEVGNSSTFQAKNAGTESAWWQTLGDDKFTTRTTFTLGGYVGLQSAY